MLQSLSGRPRHQLLRDKLRIEAVIHQLETQLQAEVDPDVDEADPGLATYEVVRALLANARRKAADITHALNRIQAGGYGICEDCGRPIDPERLEIFPQTTLCVACKGKREKRAA